jgi:hypothetical protein
LEKLGGEEEKTLFEEALANFHAYNSFQDLGYHFLHVGHSNLAQPFL